MRICPIELQSFVGYVLCRIVGVWLPSTFYSLNLILLEILLQIIGLDF